MFGEPTNRSRGWRILYNPDKMKWNCIYTFSELVEILLLPTSSPLLMTPSVFLTASPAELEAHSRCFDSLSPSEKTHVQRFQKMVPDKKYYDLASNPEHRKRTETSDGALMTLTTNSHIWISGSTVLGPG